MSDLGTMTVQFAANTSLLTAGIGVAEKAIAGLAEMGPIGMVGAGLLAVGAIAVGVGAKTASMAGDFQQSITKLYTTANEAKGNLQMVGDGILAMSGQVGTSAQTLAQAMYWIESGGLHGAAGLDALRIAAEAAKAENANLDKVSIALAASINAYGSSGMTTAQIMNTLTAATGQGMMTFEQLSGSLSSVLPASAKFGISLTDVTAALATMTAQGDPAAAAATHLKQVIIALEAPSKIGAAALKSVGLTSQQVANEMKVSLPDALKMITDAVGKTFPEGSAAYNQAIKNIAGGSKQMMGFLELTGSHMKTFGDNVATISGKVKGAGNDLMGWSDIQGNFNFKMDAARASIEAVGIKIGTLLLPALSHVMDFINPLITGFSNWMSSSNGMASAMAGLGKSAAPVVGFFLSMGKAIASVNWGAIWAGIVTGATMVWGILKQLGGFLAANFAPVWLQLVAMWQSQLLPMFKQLWSGIQPMLPLLELIGAVILTVLVGAIGGAIKGIAGFLSGLIVVIGGVVTLITGAVQVVGGIIGFFTDLLTGKFGKLSGDLGMIWQGIINMFLGAWQIIAGIFQTAWYTISGIVSGFVDGVRGFFQALSDDIVGHSIIPDMVNSIVGWFVNLGPRALSAVSSVCAQIGSFFSGLASSAVSWGANLIGGFISGIQSMLGSIGSTMSNVVGFIGSFLPHSPAKQGELSHLNEYGPALMQGISQGIIHSKPMITQAMNMTLSPFALLTPQAYSAAAGGSTGSSGDNAALLREIKLLTDALKNHQTVLAVDGNVLGNAVVSKMRAKTGVR